MNKNLLIVGAGIYSMVARDIAREMNCFEKIDFVDDEKEQTPDGNKVLGKISDLEKLSVTYSNIIIAIGNPQVRLSLIKRITEEMPYRIVVLVSPRAYIAPSVQIGKGSIIEPMAVIHAGSALQEGCFISAGAVVNHGSMCASGVHVDCNAVVAGGTFVPVCTKVVSCTVFSKDKKSSLNVLNREF